MYTETISSINNDRMLQSTAAYTEVSSPVYLATVLGMPPDSHSDYLISGEAVMVPLGVSFSDVLKTPQKLPAQCMLRRRFVGLGAAPHKLFLTTVLILLDGDDDKTFSRRQRLSIP